MKYHIVVFGTGHPGAATPAAWMASSELTASYAEATEFAEAHLIAVPTPQRQGHFAADLTFGNAMIAEFSPLPRHPADIFDNPTPPVGTPRPLAALLVGRLLPGIRLGPDVTLVLTEREEFRRSDPNRLASIVRGCRVEHGQNCVDKRLLRALGWEYQGIRTQ